MRKSATVAMTVVRISWGGLLTAAPDAVLRGCPRTRTSTAASAVVRVLGARHILQGLATATGVMPVAWGAVPDALHAATMAGLALGSDRWRTAACADLLIAGAFAVGGTYAARAAAPSGQGLDDVVISQSPSGR
ncbi:hypothetical protein [Streptomyces sediminimaris]|uniref:hypothetical protein n=1 Tax=Streptomyces sediminimaris TaxID=3383721 RepID=UPI00399BDC24